MHSSLCTFVLLVHPPHRQPAPRGQETHLMLQKGPENIHVVFVT